MNWEEVIKERRKISHGYGDSEWWRGYADHKFWGDERTLYNGFIGVFKWIDSLSDEEKQDEGIQEDIAYMVKMAEQYAPVFNKILKDYK